MLMLTTLPIVTFFNNVHSALCEAFPITKIKKNSFITDDTFKIICEASDMKEKKCKLLKKFQTPPFGLPSEFGRASLGGVNGLQCGASPI